ncbi:putative peptidoglycan glycosyltransferase FtsW/RodA [Trichlorobacter lovleyi]|uniref:Uncharacterized protein n=1 Tax=Trichlorobacter lovleyi (strain ATCC BAA-1151 / DSM 17278 / SZ) TaxID=398767 RepID=B3E565_TRIL1|nr:hypothetical protein [Trichlorobacter lovleyi]ACD96052.1 hypothetical protein Glov_2336 [Trichlorobacter lovleyi SZ]
MNYLKTQAGWYVGLSVLMLLTGFVFVCRAFAYASDLPENAPPLVYAVALIAVALVGGAIKYSRLQAQPNIRWILVSAAFTLAMLPSLFPSIELYAVATGSDLFACLLFLSGCILCSNAGQCGWTAKVMLVLGGLLIVGLVVSHGNLGLALVGILLASVLLCLYRRPLAGLFLLIGTVVFLGTAIVARPYRLHHVQRILTHSEPGSPHVLALQSMQTGGMIGSTPSMPTQESAAQVCIDTAPAFEQLLCQGNNGEYTFAVIGSWYGLVGMALVILSFALLAFMVVRTVRKAGLEAMTYLLVIWGGAVIGLAMLHVLYNVGLFFWPIPLPFFSSSGPIILTVCIAAGIMGYVEQRHAVIN